MKNETYSDKTLREKIRISKVVRQTTYKAIAQEIGINYQSFINWLNDQFTFSESRKQDIMRYLERR